MSKRKAVIPEKPAEPEAEAPVAFEVAVPAEAAPAEVEVAQPAPVEVAVPVVPEPVAVPVIPEVPAPQPLPQAQALFAFPDSLRVLEEMGFLDRAANCKALILSAGDVNGAINRLLA